MIFTINGYDFGDGLVEENKVVSVDAWYDRHTRLWCIQLEDENGYQVGNAEWVYGKADAMARKAELEEEYNI